MNCQGDHVAISRDCPKWKIEKDIVTLKYTEKISFADARKRLQTSFDPSKDSYATVTQTPPQSSRPLPPWAKKIRLPIDFRTEIEYLKYILNYCLTRLDTLDEITPENPVPQVAPSSDETPPPPQTIQNKQMKPQSQVLSPLYNLQLQTMMRMKLKYSQWAIKELSMKIVLKRTSTILFQQKRLPLAPQLVSSLAPVCQKGGEGEIYLRSLPSLPTLPSLEDGGQVREISLPHGLPVSQTTQVRGPRVLPKVVEIAVQLIDIPPLKPPGTIKTATKDKTKSREKNTPS